MKIILTMAVSANGIIATKDGSEDFLSHDNWLQFVRLAKRVGCFMWGRKTYESVIAWEGEHLKAFDEVEKIIISSSDIQLKEGFVKVSSPESALAILKEKGYEEAIITGGAITNSYFAKNNMIDEVIFDINPSIVGDGTPVFAPEDFMLKLELAHFDKIGSDILEVKYKVKK